MSDAHLLLTLIGTGLFLVLWRIDRDATKTPPAYIDGTRTGFLGGIAFTLCLAYPFVAQGGGR